MFRLMVFGVVFTVVAGRMCYFCSDTSEENGKNACQKYIRTMRYYQQKFVDTSSYKSDKYIKNCTGYGSTSDQESLVYCMIAWVQLGGGVRSYIRDCSDGKSFFSPDLNAEFTDAVLPDNQTTCKYTGQGFLACVTLCGGDEFDSFCNGPTLSASSIQISIFLLFITFTCAILLDLIP